MREYVMTVETREGDVFKGIYSHTPTLDQVLVGIRSGDNPSSIERLVTVVTSAKYWPSTVIVRYVEVVRSGASIIGKIIFNVQRGS